MLNSVLEIAEWVHRLPDPHAIARLQKEIESHVPSFEELENLTDSFIETQGLAPSEPLFLGQPPSINGYIVSCGTCGLCNLSKSDSPYREVTLKEISTLISLTGKRLEEYKRLEALSPIHIPINQNFDMKSVNLQDIMSVYISEENNMRYNLHPELVHVHPKNGECTMICDCCYKKISKGEILKLSIVNGVDFGNPDCLGLVNLSVVEQMMVARVRVYHSIVNIRKRFLSKDALSGQQMHGHSIVFPHDSPEVASLAVLLDMIQHLQSEKRERRPHGKVL